MKSNSQSCTIKKRSRENTARNGAVHMRWPAIVTVITVPLLMFIFCLLATSSSRHFLVQRGASDLSSFFAAFDGAFGLLPRPRELLVSRLKTTSPFSSNSPNPHYSFPLKINSSFPKSIQLSFLLLGWMPRFTSFLWHAET